MPQQFTRILSHHDIAEIVSQVGVDTFMRELIERLQKGFREYSTSEFEIPVRDGFHYEKPAPGLIEWMPLHRREHSVFIKTVGYHPTNPSARRIPTVTSVFNLFDPTNGRLTAVADGALLTAMRTGAASAVATRLLAKTSSPVALGLIGCGAQAVTQLHGIMQVADVAEIRIYDTDKSVSQSFAERAASVNHGHVSIQVVPPNELVRKSDVISTATSVDIDGGPVFDNCEVRDHLHVNAVGSDLPGKTELPQELLQKSNVCPDFPEQAVLEGECQQLTPGQLGPSITDIAAAPSGSAHMRTQRTVFDSTGFALEDYIVTQLALSWAEKLRIGQTIELAASVDDPWNPYAAVTSQLIAGAT